MLYCTLASFAVVLHIFFFFCKQKTAYEMRISDWSSDVCSSDLVVLEGLHLMADRRLGDVQLAGRLGEGEVAGGGFEGPERVQGRQFPGHASIKKTYAKREITSFDGISHSQIGRVHV